MEELINNRYTNNSNISSVKIEGYRKYEGINARFEAKK